VPVTAALAGIERWFVRQGVPHFVAGFEPGGDLLRSMSPVLMVVLPVALLVELAPAPSWPRRVAGIALAVAVLGVGHVLASRLRGRAVRRRPDRVDPEHVAAFVAVGPLVALAVGVDGRWAAAAALAGLLLVGSAWLVAAFALVSVVTWAVRRTMHEVGEIGVLAGRGLPMLVLFGLLTFFSSDLWRVAVALSPARLCLVGVSFLVLTVVFLLVKLPEELGRLRTDGSGEEISAACAGTSLDGVAVPGGPTDPGGPAGPATLGPPQRANMLVFLLLCQLIQVALLATTVWVFFLAFGSLAIRPEVIAGWLGHGPHPAYLFGLALPGLSSEVVHVSTLLSALSAFYFTVSAVTDSAYRDEFFSRTLAELTRAALVRRRYLSLLATDAHVRGTGAETDVTALRPNG
jgi:hypothetical protein